MLLPDGTHVNHAFVKDGWCWWYRKYAMGDHLSNGARVLVVAVGLNGDFLAEGEG